MAAKSIICVALFCVAILSLVFVTFVEADCRWTVCHGISAGDGCGVLGPGYKLEKSQPCHYVFGKREYCCN
ncbi:hypothetical protein TSAR_007368 [Trichomalopsis sarcophagae]|uniref:Single domain-containing protein n=1 Tax=Trichomalopsis sarcophagae TaxID=543379 RepID=A0A232ETQ8_9HYME|nr:hypothetical protein TSAR_007368 [Trichomalopsis sarcophagae]